MAGNARLVARLREMSLAWEKAGDESEMLEYKRLCTERCRSLDEAADRIEDLYGALSSIAAMGERGEQIRIPHSVFALLAKIRGEPSPDDSADGLISVPKSHTWEA